MGPFAVKPLALESPAVVVAVVPDLPASAVVFLDLMVVTAVLVGLLVFLVVTNSFSYSANYL